MTTKSVTGRAPPADPEGRPMADVARMARRVGRQRQAADARASKPPKGESGAPLPPWLSGDKRGLPMRPPGKP
jgi:hypothetical protein